MLPYEKERDYSTPNPCHDSQGNAPAIAGIQGRKGLQSQRQKLERGVLTQ